jgi:hypothetical protein
MTTAVTGENLASDDIDVAGSVSGATHEATKTLTLGSRSLQRQDLFLKSERVDRHFSYRESLGLQRHALGWTRFGIR